MEQILVNYFSTKTFSSIRRQLSYYGFTCLFRNQEISIYSHPNFKKNDKDRLKLMKPINHCDTVSEKGIKQELCFYQHAVEIKEAQIKQLKMNIARTNKANKVIKSKLQKSQAFLDENIENACKFAYFLYFLSPENYFVNVANNLSSVAYQNYKFDWDKVVSYKGLNIKSANSAG